MHNVQNFALLWDMGKAIQIKKDVAVKDINAETLGVNPFVKSLKIPVHKMLINGQYKVTKELAADGKPIMLPVEVEIEAEPFTKVYNDANRRKMMVVLSTRAKELYLWVLYEIEAGKDYLWINKSRYMKENDISSMNTYRNALKELIVQGFLQGTVASDVYWINPSLFFSGSRTNKYPKNVVKK